MVDCGGRCYKTIYILNMFSCPDETIELVPALEVCLPDQTSANLAKPFQPSRCGPLRALWLLILHFTV